MTTDPSLPNHTIYAPVAAPNISMPFIAWGNGACQTDGAQYDNLLVEIASHGYVIAADGPPGGAGGQSQVSDMRDSVDWAVGGGASAYGEVDVERLATAGHSCGGLEAMSTAYHDTRVKRIMLFNIAIFQDERRYLLEEINVPVAWFVGGPEDMGYPNVSQPLFHSGSATLGYSDQNTGGERLRSAPRRPVSAQDQPGHGPRRDLRGHERWKVRKGGRGVPGVAVQGRRGRQGCLPRGRFGGQPRVG
ncbi:hypothetical protein IMZ48_11265 [Candidatus Bathyarchaeota archaeon]|nr:hypothetical protein [Candidatus Bathyarchaeota archaeon]